MDTKNNFFVLKYTRTGHYTVKSAYWVQVNVVDAGKKSLEVNQPSLDGLYQTVWNLETSPKIKHFIWICLSNALPVAENMVNRHIGRDRRCSRCGEESESINHLLFRCHYARLTWAVANVHIPPAGAWSDSLYSNLYWVLNLKKEYPMEQVNEEMIPWLLWRLWKNRNELIFRSKEYTAPETIQKALDDAREWKSKEEILPTVEKTPPTVAPERRWRPPPPTKLKCNTDSAWRKEDGSGGVGWILRDHNGHMLWAGARKVEVMESVIETEAEALRWAIQVLAGFGYNGTTFETDSQVLANMLNGEEETWPRLKPIIQEISTTLLKLKEVKVVYYPRSGNRVADRIAKEASTFTSFVPKLYSIPPVWLFSSLEVESIIVEH